MTRTVVGIFDNESDAREAVQQLQDDGISRSNIDMSSNGNGTRGNYERTGTTNMQSTDQDSAWNRDSDQAATNRNMSGNYNSNQDNSGFFERIGNFFGSLFDDDKEASRYSEMGRNGTIVTVHANSMEEADRAADILDECGAVNTDQQTDYDHATGNLSNTQSGMSGGSGSAGMRRRSRIFDRPVAPAYRLNSGDDDTNYQGTDRMPIL